MEDSLARALAKAQRQERGQILATLIGWCGDFELAEEAFQDALLAAAQHWEREGIPAKPGAWLTTIARRKAIDRLRKFNPGGEDSAALEAPIAAAEEPEDYPDERLKLIFICCHPALPPEHRIALTLNALGGLSTAETAAAFLVPVPAMAQRLVRAKRKIKDAGLPYYVPPPHLLADRVDSVLAVLYLIFTEGYAATAGESVMRPDLCEEAIRLGRLLELLVRENVTRLGLAEAQRAEILGLLALMLLIHARRDARVGSQGELIGLDDQDRGRWDRKGIAQGLALLEAAIHLGQTGPYQVQAAIQSLHAGAPGPEATDWPRIAGLYEVLLQYTDTAVIRLNRAVAVAFAGAPAEGLGMLETLGADLDAYGPYHLARAELLHRAGREAEAFEAYGKALDLTGNARERNFIRRKLEP
jgi:RNA polymerase sigma-70 factor (ECF subfamily)